MRVEGLFQRIGPVSAIARLLGQNSLDLSEADSPYEGSTYAERLRSWAEDPSSRTLENNRMSSAALARRLCQGIFGHNAEFNMTAAAPAMSMDVILLYRTDRSSSLRETRHEYRLVLRSEYEDDREAYAGWLLSEDLRNVQVWPKVGAFNGHAQFSSRDMLVLPVVKADNIYYENHLDRMPGAFTTVSRAGAWLPFPGNDYLRPDFILQQMNTLSSSIGRQLLTIIRKAHRYTHPQDSAWVEISEQQSLLSRNASHPYPPIMFSTKLLRVISNMAVAMYGWGLAYHSNLNPLLQLLDYLDGLEYDCPVFLGLSAYEADYVTNNVGATCTACGGRGGHTTRAFMEYSFYRREDSPRSAESSHARRSTATFCSNCVTDTLVNCTVCQTRFLGQQGFSDSHFMQCPHCHVMNINRVQILNYSYRPDPLTFHALDGEGDEHTPGTLYMGMEIEMECDEISVDDAREDFLPNLPLGCNGDGFFYAKSDSSLSNGFELCTKPFTPDWGFENFPFEYFNEALRDNLFYEAPSNAGQHIHVNRASFTRDHLVRFLGFHGHADKFVQMVGGRGETGYASWNRGMLDWLKDKHAVEYDGGVGTFGRVALNLGRDDTIELRYPQGVASGNLIRKNIEWIDAVYSFTKTLTDEQYDLVQDPGYLLFWIASHPERYGTLQDFIDRMVPRIKEFDIQTEGAI